ncbi:MAG: hypothetical protein ACREAA_14225 [Candidatus Polarisedimenticolia bacterium]
MAAPDARAELSPLASALLEGRAPHAIRLSAARGVLPLARPELLRVLVALQRDADHAVRQEASSRLCSLSIPELKEALSDPATVPEVLHHIALSASMKPELVEPLLVNPSTAVVTLEALIPRLGATHLDQLLLNQQRLIANPRLLDRIAAHPSATPLHRSRVEEYRRHFIDRPVAFAPEPPQAHATIHGPPPAPPELPPVVEAQAPAGEEAAADDVMADNATRRIMRMNTAEKIQLAFKGSREDRTILIKDPSKSVQEAVMESPKLTENEVEAIARMRSVTEEVLRLIAGNRDWSKNYAVISALAANPKTPPAIAMTMVSRLNQRDLKILAVDKNVSEVIRRHAKKVVDSRNERTGGRPGH